MREDAFTVPTCQQIALGGTIVNHNTRANLIGTYLTSFLLIMIIVPVITYLSDYGDSFIRSLVYIGSSGGIGGTLYCIRGFYKHLAEGDFTLGFTWWYIFRPFISTVVGVFAYFLIVGGLLSMGLTLEGDPSRSVMFYCAVAFLAGFSLTRFAELADRLSSTLFQKKEEDE